MLESLILFFYNAGYFPDLLRTKVNTPANKIKGNRLWKVKSNNNKCEFNQYKTSIICSILS